MPRAVWASGSPASAAGLKKGQLIQRVGEQPVQNPREFARAVAGLDGPVSIETDLGPMTIK